MHRVGLHVLEHLEHMRTQRLGMVGTHMTASPTVTGSAGWARRQVARFIVPAEPAPSSHCVCVCVCARARARVCVCVIRATFPCLGPEERARFLCSGPCLAEGTASLNHASLNGGGGKRWWREAGFPQPQRSASAARCSWPPHPVEK